MNLGCHLHSGGPDKSMMLRLQAADHLTLDPGCSPMYPVSSTLTACNMVRGAMSCSRAQTARMIVSLVAFYESWHLWRWRLQCISQ